MPYQLDKLEEDILKQFSKNNNLKPQFFDKAFLAKELPEMPSAFIDPLSNLVEFVNKEMNNI